MDQGLWSATSGAKAKSLELDSVAQNLANINTDGYQREDLTFKEYLAEIEHPELTKDIAPGAIKESELYPLFGKAQSMVAVDGVHTRFGGGVIRETGRSLDLALEKPGAFFEVLTGEGVQVTRLGSFRRLSDGKLGLADGSKVLVKRKDQPPEKRMLDVPLDLKQPLSITLEGQIFDGQELLGELSLVQPESLQNLQKVSGARFRLVNGNTLRPFASGVLQGKLEGSNVNPIAEMSRMIRSSRMFEHDLKAMRTVGEMMGREVNDVGKL
jgi:flagellar basal-body rod protein FlgF